MNRPWLSHGVLACCLCAAGFGAIADTSTRGILDLQPFMQSTTLELANHRTVRLDDLAPSAHAWYLLTLQAGTAHAVTWHLENASPSTQTLRLDATGGGRLVVRGAAGDACSVSLAVPSALDAARRSALPFAPLCDGRLFVRNAVRGHRTSLEATTEFLRDHVWGGERIIGFVRHEFYTDAFALHGDAALAADRGAATSLAPPAARLKTDEGARSVVPAGLGLDIGPARQGLRLGAWAAVRDRPGIFVSALLPAAIPDAPPVRGRPQWHADPAEAQALDYFVAFDLARFDIGFALGTEHPRLGWSDHAATAQRDDRKPGPDGIDSAAPLVRTGLLNPALAARAVATFTGGFKREHGAFRYGPLAAVHGSSHYGFVEQGVVFSTLQPGLSTLLVTGDGRVDIKTWGKADDALLPTLTFARQNGVPLVERTNGGAPALGAFVDQWGPGNWSGSADEQQRTLRAGACILERDGRRYLVYGWFSTATPGTMARAFLALGCRDAMHLDMNALEHTYLALYVREGARLGVQHLVDGMSVLDQVVDGVLVPRFIGSPDDRDFFYVLDKGPGR